MEPTPIVKRARSINNSEELYLECLNSRLEIVDLLSALLIPNSSFGFNLNFSPPTLMSLPSLKSFI